MEEKLLTEIKTNKLIITKINGQIRCKRNSKNLMINKILYQIYNLIDSNNGNNIDDKINILETERIYKKKIFDNEIKCLILHKKTLQAKNKKIRNMMKYTIYGYID